MALEKLMEREQEGQLIPSFVEEMIKRLEEGALETSGIFRISGSKNAINQVKNQVNRGITVELAFLDDHVVSSLLKQFFRFLPDPVIPFSLYQTFLDCHNDGCYFYFVFFSFLINYCFYFFICILLLLLLFRLLLLFG